MTLRVIAILILVLIVLPFTATAQERTVPENPVSLQMSFAPLVKRVAPAVVNIYTKRTVSTGFRNPFMDDPFFGQLFGQDLFGGRMRKQVESALGSGVIVSEEGLVVTNAHVVRGAEQITVVLADGREYEANLALSDEASDLALLRVQEEVVLPFVTLRPSESLEVGDLVLAIGNPFGVGQTVTSGIVSAQGRSSLDINDYNFFIQTDAAINPGNSGGPLVAMDGRVVGINTAIYSRSGGSLGIGFAIPSEMVASVIAAEVSGQKGEGGIIRPWLGVTTQDVTSDIAVSLGMDKPYGALISHLHMASPLQKAGVQVGDVIVRVGGRDIRDSAEVKFRMATVPLGKSTRFTVLHKGKEKSVDVVAIVPPNDPPRNDTTLEGEHAFKGIVVANINPAVAIELGLKAEVRGVVVLSTPYRSYASRVLYAGDLLLEVNGREIKDVQDVDAAFAASAVRGGAYDIVLKRKGQTRHIRMH